MKKLAAIKLSLTVIGFVLQRVNDFRGFLQKVVLRSRLKGRLTDPRWPLAHWASSELLRKKKTQKDEMLPHLDVHDEDDVIISAQGKRKLSPLSNRM